MQKVVSIGAADGKMNIADAMAKTIETVTANLVQNGFASPALTMPEIASAPDYNLQPLWHVDGLKPGDKAFVDIQNDVTLDDIGLAMREGFDTVEHVKRYTTAGMGIDQGKTGNVNIIGHMAEVSNKKAGEIGTTTFRSPFTPVDFGAIAGQRNGKVVLPFRHTPITEWNKKHGAVMYEAGARWQRPGYFPIKAELCRTQSTPRQKPCALVLGFMMVRHLANSTLADAMRRRLLTYFIPMISAIWKLAWGVMVSC
jgi:sarcosine oxidase subunit alpha